MASGQIKDRSGGWGSAFIKGAAKGALTGATLSGAIPAAAASGAGFLTKLVDKWKGMRKNPEKTVEKKQKNINWIKKFRFLKEVRGIPEVKIKNKDINSVDVNSTEYKEWESGGKSTLPPSPFGK